MRIAVVGAIGVAVVAALVITGVAVFGGASTVTGTPVAVGVTSAEPTVPSGEDRGGADAAVGDCVNLRPVGTTGAMAEKINCLALDATYEVGYRREGTTGPCPTESYDQYTQTGPAGDFMLCLMMNGRTGDCFNGYSAPGIRKSKVDCKTADATVSGRLDDRVDPAACPVGTRWRLVYPERNRTVCLTPLRG